MRIERVPRMTLADLAGADLSISLVSKIERGATRPSIQTLETLARRLGTTPAILLGGEHGSDDRTRDLEATLLLALDDAEGALAATRGATPTADPRAVRAAALLALDRDDEAAECADSVLADPGASVDSRARACVVRAATHERRGGDVSAQRLLTRALDLVNDGGDADVAVECLRRLATIALRQGAIETARNLHGQATREASRAVNPRRRAQRLRAMATRALQDGDSARAARDLRAAIEIARFGRAVQARAEIAALGADLAPSSDALDSPNPYAQAASAILQRAPRYHRPTSER